MNCMIIRLCPTVCRKGIPGIGICQILDQIHRLVGNRLQFRNFHRQIQRLQLGKCVASLDLGHSGIIMALCQCPVLGSIGILRIDTQRCQLISLCPDKLFLCQFFIQLRLIFTLDGRTDHLCQAGIAFRCRMQAVNKQVGISTKGIGLVGAEQVFCLCIVHPIIGCCQVPHKSIDLGNLIHQIALGGTMVYRYQHYLKFRQCRLNIQQNLFHGFYSRFRSNAAAKIIDANVEDTQLGLEGNDLIGKGCPMSCHSSTDADIINGRILREITCVIGPHFRIGVTKNQHIRLSVFLTGRNRYIPEGRAGRFCPQADPVTKQLHLTYCVASGFFRIRAVVAINHTVTNDQFQANIQISGTDMEATVQYRLGAVFNLNQFCILGSSSNTVQIIAAAIFIGAEYNTNIL